jgi:hypothetical protein
MIFHSEPSVFPHSHIINPGSFLNGRKAGPENVFVNACKIVGSRNPFSQTSIGRNPPRQKSYQGAPILKIIVEIKKLQSDEF